MNNGEQYWHVIWRQFRKHPLGMFALGVVLMFCLVGIYAPFLASSKPLFVCYNDRWYFPLFRYLFFPGFYTKRLDIFFNLLMFSLPLFLVCFFALKNHPKIRFWTLLLIALAQFLLFFYFGYGGMNDPGSSAILNKQKQTVILEKKIPTWSEDLKYMTPYAKLNLLVDYKNLKAQNESLKTYSENYESKEKTFAPTLWNIQRNNEKEHIERIKEKLKINPDDKEALADLNYIEDRCNWLKKQSENLAFMTMPLVRNFHWEDDAGGGQNFNQYLPWWDLTRINRKDLLPALLFGIRISLVVGILAVGLSLLISIPIGAYAGYYGGTFDIIVSRMLEIWESMPTFFMLLMIVAITQSKSIFLIITMIGFFGWTGFSRYIRGEFFKQRNLPYVEACHSLGFRDPYIMFSHILPNAIPPVLTLIPFAVMAAITSEAGLSFLGLGEEGSTSWGVLMDEGRTAFPAESYLLWPPAILLTVLLVAIALVGDSLRDALDPKMHK